MSLNETLKLTFIRVVGEIPAAVEQLAQSLNLQLRVTTTELVEDAVFAQFVVEGRNWVNHQIEVRCGLSYIPEADLTRFAFKVEPSSMSDSTALGDRLLFGCFVDQNAESAARSILAYAYGRKLPEQS